MGLQMITVQETSETSPFATNVGTCTPKINYTVVSYALFVACYTPELQIKNNALQLIQLLQKIPERVPQ